MKKIIARLVAFWNEDRSLTIMSILLLVFIFILVPTLEHGRTSQVVTKIVYSLLVFTGIMSVVKQKSLIILVSLFAGLNLVAYWISDFEHSRAVLIASDISAIFFNIIFAIVILIKTFQPGEITFHRIEGSIVAYLLVGLIFASVFHAIYLAAGPSSFNNLKAADLKEFLYFSFTSLTTMGYGDITPVHPLSRSMANFEALIGQLYPAILIARLVTMEFESSSKKKQ